MLKFGDDDIGGLHPGLDKTLPGIIIFNYTNI
jgi:hypothetical protein